jgi:excisionase family DNA binding protein
MSGERWLTVQQVADMLQLHPETIREWLRGGKLDGVRLGERRTGWRIRESEVRRFLEPGKAVAA